MKPVSFKLGLVQMRVEGGMRQDNLNRAAEWIARAAADGANVILLPEALSLGWTHPSARTEADAIPDGDSCVFLRELARRHAVYLCAGLIERNHDRIHNAAVLINPDGQVILHHRKLNELDIAQDLYTGGDRLAVAQTPLGKMGLMICADAFVAGEVISRTLGCMGAEIILSPCAWAVPADHDNDRDPYGDLWRKSYQPVAREFGMWIAGCSNVGKISAGPWKDRKCIGTSLVVDAMGAIAAQGPYGENAEALLLVNVTLPL